jgi:hypothetical protein
MNENSRGQVDNFTGRWAVYVVPTINYAVKLTQSGLAWGLLLFPNKPFTGSICTTDMGPSVTSDHLDNVKPTCKVNNATAIKNAIPSYAQGMGTPTDYAMRAARDYLTHLSDGNPKYIILATDGVPSCTDGLYCVDLTCAGCTITAAQAAITEIAYTTAANILTYVVGIAVGGDSINGATSVEMNDTLNQMATTGGTQRAICAKGNLSCNAYYPANNRQQLTDALTKITSKLNSCTIPLTALPPDPTKVGVGINDGSGHVTQIFQTGHGDDSNGSWDYTDSSMQSITLTGAACEQVAQGTCGCLEIYYGCASVPTPQQGGLCM